MKIIDRISSTIDSVGKKLDEIYPKLFDALESPDRKESMRDLRIRLVGNFFINVGLREKQKYSTTEESQENLQEIVTGFFNMRNQEVLRAIGENKKLNEQELVQIGLAIAKEFMFILINSNNENKNTFKMVIDEAIKMYNLPPSETNKLKTFVIEYMIHREKVDKMYQCFVDINNIYSFIFKGSILNSKDCKIEKGKWGLEVFIKPGVDIGILNDKTGGVNAFFHEFIGLFPIIHERPGGITSVIFVRENNTNDATLQHERHHSMFNFDNKKILAKESSYQEQDTREIIASEFRQFYIQSVGFDIKDEFLARVYSLPFAQDTSFDFILSNYDFMSKKENSKFINEFYKKYKASFTSQEEFELYISEITNSILEEMRSNCQFFQELIQKTHFSSFLVTYFSKIPITEWQKSWEELGTKSA